MRILENRLSNKFSIAEDACPLGYLQLKNSSHNTFYPYRSSF